MPRIRRPRPLVLAALLSVAGLVVVGAAIGIVGGSVAGPGIAGVKPVDPAPARSPNAWTLDALLRHADAGEAAAIGAMTAPADPTTRDADIQQLVVRTSTGALESIRLSIPVSDAIEVIRAAGHGQLLTGEAIALGAVEMPIWVRILIGLGFAMLLVLTVRFTLRQGGIGRRGSWRPGRFLRQERSGRHADPTERPTITMADVAGADEAKLELTETIEFLKDPARFHRLGARAVRGVMLYGPPGTGKTLLAKAVAAAADVPFYSVSGSEFVEKYVGVGASRVRELFTKARSAGRGVIFIDEIDALAKVRGGVNSNEEREQTLNQLLVEMDGFGTGDEIVVIGATNRLDTLDAAVLRPGRFTRKIHVPLPDREGRLAVLRIHAANKPLTQEVDLAAVARRTYGFSGAMLADLLNEAAILSARAGAAVVGPDEVHAGWLKTAIGTSRKRSMDDRERSIIAAHEAGHAICGFLHGDKRRVEEISLFAHGDALGVTVSSSEDNDLPSERDLRARLIALMGGRVAEELLFAEVTGGASNDFEKATNIASAMVVRYGMGTDPDATDGGATGRGILSTLVGTRSEGINSAVRDAQARAIRRILDDAYAAARQTLLAEMPRLRSVSAYLYEQERVDGEAFEALMAGRLVPVDAEGWRAAAAAPRPWDTIPELFRERPAATVTVAPADALPDHASAPSPTPVTPPAERGPVPSDIPASIPRARHARDGGRRRLRPLGRHLPAVPNRLRRSLAAMVHELAIGET